MYGNLSPVGSIILGSTVLKFLIHSYPSHNEKLIRPDNCLTLLLLLATDQKCRLIDKIIQKRHLKMTNWLAIYETIQWVITSPFYHCLSLLPHIRMKDVYQNQYYESTYEFLRQTDRHVENDSLSFHSFPW